MRRSGLLCVGSHALLSERRWKARGLYPGLPAIGNLLADQATGAVRDDDTDGRALVDWVRAKDGSKSELDHFFDLLASATEGFDAG
jgi:hypothetical protein